jgi:hypothetical protein
MGNTAGFRGLSLHVNPLFVSLGGCLLALRDLLITVLDLLKSPLKATLLHFRYMERSQRGAC